MKKHLIALALCLAMAVCFAGCARDTADPAMLEFPGTHWRDTPGAATGAIFTEEQMAGAQKITFDSLDGVVTVSEADCFGAPASLRLNFHRPDTDSYFELTGVWAAYPEGTDMAAVREQLIARYGPGTESQDGHILTWTVSAESLPKSQQENFQAYQEEHSLSGPAVTLTWSDDPTSDTRPSDTLTDSGEGTSGWIAFNADAWVHFQQNFG